MSCKELGRRSRNKREDTERRLPDFPWVVFHSAHYVFYFPTSTISQQQSAPPGFCFFPGGRRASWQRGTGNPGARDCPPGLPSQQPMPRWCRTSDAGTSTVNRNVTGQRLWLGSCCKLGSQVSKTTPTTRSSPSPDLALGHHLQGLPPWDNLILSPVYTPPHTHSFTPPFGYSCLSTRTKGLCLGSVSLLSHRLHSLLLPNVHTCCPSFLTSPYLPASSRKTSPVPPQKGLSEASWDPTSTLPKPSSSSLTPEGGQVSSWAFKDHLAWLPPLSPLSSITHPTDLLPPFPGARAAHHPQNVPLSHACSPPQFPAFHLSEPPSASPSMKGWIRTS